MTPAPTDALMTPRDRFADRRRWERIALERPAALTLGLAGRAFRCWIWNLSLGGCLLRADGWQAGELCDGALRPLDPIALDHPVAGRFTGRCAWRRGESFGVRFDDDVPIRRRALQCVWLVLAAGEATGTGLSVPAFPAPACPAIDAVA